MQKSENNKNKTENNIKNTNKPQIKEEQKHTHIYFPIQRHLQIIPWCTNDIVDSIRLML